MCDWMSWHMAYKEFLINLHPSQKVTQKVTTVRYLFTIELISWWNFHSFNIWILSNSFFIAKWWAKFSALLQICFWSSVSLFNLAICIVNCRTKTKRNSIRKSCMMSLASIKISHLTLVFGGKRPDLLAPLQQTNEQPPTTWKVHLNLLQITFPAVYWLRRGVLPTLIINGSG